MSKSPLLVKQTEKILMLANKMREQKVSCAIVIKKDEPIGIVTERDLVNTMANYTNIKSLPEVKVKDVMTSPVLTLPENSLFLEGMILSRTRNIRHLPVVNENNNCVGLISFHDLNNAYIHLIEEQHKAIEESVKNRTLKLENANKKLQSLSLEDPLLGIGNRRSMKVDLKHTDAAFKRYQTPYTLVLLDLDFFKKYNDTYGHIAGDKILKKITKHLQEHIRASDRIYRYGGEEFLLLLPETLVEGASTLLERLVTSVRELNIPHKSSPFGKITVSAGFCSTDVSDEKCPIETKAMIKLADEGLYQAKKAGRSTFCSAHDAKESCLVNG